MKQIKFFTIPDEVEKANEFLAQNPPEGVATVSKGEQCYIVVNYDDFTYPNAYKAGEIRELMLSNTKTSMTSAISRGVMEIDLKKYKGELEVAQKNQAENDAVVVPMVIGKDGKSKGKEIPDYKVQEAKTKRGNELAEEITKLTDTIANIEMGIKNLTASIARDTIKNDALQAQLDLVTAPQA